MLYPIATVQAAWLVLKRQHGAWNSIQNFRISNNRKTHGISTESNP